MFICKTEKKLNTEMSRIKIQICKREFVNATIIVFNFSLKLD